jgi:hypothetical protein
MNQAMKRLAIFILLSGTLSAALPFIEDDYAKARAEATQRKLPLFVEVWAPW